MATRVLTSGISALALLAVSAVASAQEAETSKPDDTMPGRAIYERSCQMCHENPADERAIPFNQLIELPRETIETALGPTGIMAPMAAALSAEQKTDLIDYLVSGQSEAPDLSGWTDDFMCAPEDRTVDLTGDETWTTFGVNRDAWRYVSSEQAGLTKEDMANLEIDWVIGEPDGFQMSVATANVGDTLFYGGGGNLSALDKDTGCVKWTYRFGAQTRSPLTYGQIGDRKAILFVEEERMIHVVDAQSGELIWKADGQPERGDGGDIRPGVIVYEDKVIVPISASGVFPNVESCCTGHGALVVLDAATGDWLWEYHTMKESEPNGLTNSLGQPQQGPSGAPIWAQPTVDAKRNRVIVTTGENTSLPATNTSDAIIAIDLDTGEPDWIFQAMEGDAWNAHCRGTDETSGPNCPWHWDEENIGRDFDFGGAAVLVTAEIAGEATDLVLAGQKSGHLWALRADDGSVVWSQQVGEGTALGGNHWGIATDGKTAILTINDPIRGNEDTAKPGVFAFRVTDGEPLWGYDAQADCDDGRGEKLVRCEGLFGFSATPLIVGETVVAGTLDGKLFVFDIKTGEVLNEIDTAMEFESLNGLPAQGGSIDSHAIAVAKGMIVTGSGYARFGQNSGNALVTLKPVSND
ncbi:MAG: hypothetical protein CMK07_03130 [Ponticaulis sp.]|nr:hypothetical protein [Ponticaulis sp.]